MGESMFSHVGPLEQLEGRCQTRQSSHHLAVVSESSTVEVCEAEETLKESIEHILQHMDEQGLEALLDLKA